jgi:hypothetical protein
MLWSAYFTAHFASLLGQVSASARPLVPPVAPTQITEPLLEIEDPPSSQAVSNIESWRLSSPWKFTPTGVVKSPTVEIADLSCRRSSFRYFSCEYKMRVREFEASIFGPWIIRRTVFSQIDSEWVMYDQKERCAKFDPQDLPKYCFRYAQ